MVYLRLSPVAMIDHSSGTPTLYYIHTDQVLQPQKMTDANGAVVWDRAITPFGETVSVTGTLQQTLRFPGQRADDETNLFQNWHRDYDASSSLGRYVQSDPIGLLGGINTYAYVAGNPLSYIDPNGLEVRLADQPAFGGKGNHSFIYSDKTHQARGRDGSSGWQRSNGVPRDLFDNLEKYPYTPIPIPDGVTEEEFISCIVNYPGWEKGAYIPFVDDCQNQSDEALRYCGVENPPWLPNGRTDIDESFQDAILNGLRKRFPQNMSPRP